MFARAVVVAASLASLVLAVPAANTTSLAVLLATDAAKPSSTIPLTATDTAAVAAAEATELTLSPTSNVRGKVFDRWIEVIMENVDLAVAVADPNFAKFVSEGILLTNFHGNTHPSKPNYIAQFAGDYFGADTDDFTTLPFNVSTVWDLLDDRGISFGIYSENAPYTGFQGLQFLNASNGQNNYVRKHNNPVNFARNTQNPHRLAVIKNFTLLHEDLAAKKLPQHMIIVPNEQNDAHDTGIAFGANFLVEFLMPLLQNPDFNTDRTLVTLTFDESGTDNVPNALATVLLGGVIPSHLKGTKDEVFFTHYSEIATIEANWDLHHLGRYDVGANVFSFVADATGNQNTPVPNPNPHNTSYPGALSFDGTLGPIPAPNVFAVHNGRTILPTILAEYVLEQECTNYDITANPPDGLHPPKLLPEICAKLPGPNF